MNVGDIKNKYEESFQFLQARKKRQANQLVLLSNLRRNDQSISSTLLITLFNRVMSSIYDDKMQVKFLPSQGITQEQINSYNILAQSDYQEMGKAKLDYDWAWDTLFFGRGYCETIRFDKKRKLLQPHSINPLVFGYDPYFENVQDWRYYWKWISKSKYDLDLLKSGGVISVDVTTLPTGIDPYIWEYKTKRDAAREGVQPPIQPQSNDVYQILEFYGYNEKGVKTVYWIDKSFSKIIYEKALDLDDGDEVIAPDGTTVSRKSNWPIVVKESFRVPHSSIPISIADLLEDKHRAKSVLLNLAYIAAKDQANPIYWYNDNVQDQTAFLARQVNQHIKLNDTATGDGSIGPINKASTMSPDLANFITMLQQEANEPIGTGMTMQPESSDTTATASSIDQQLNDLAQSLQSKVMQFGEQEFWSQWFHRYAKHANELKEKTANIIGVKGVDSKIISLKDFRADFPPGVLIYSAKQAEYKDLVKRRDFMQLYPAISQTLDPDGMRNFQKHVFFPLFIQDTATLSVMFPKTLDEMTAEEENQRLSKGQMVQAQEMDNHTTHIYTHYMVEPKNWEVWLHIDEHEKMLAQQKKQAMMQQQAELADNMGASNGQPGGTNTIASGQGPNVGPDKTNPQQAAVPLKAELSTNIQSK